MEVLCGCRQSTTRGCERQRRGTHVRDLRSAAGDGRGGVAGRGGGALGSERCSGGLRGVWAWRGRDGVEVWSHGACLLVAGCYVQLIVASGLQN
jgi:hypothetical protein